MRQMNDTKENTAMAREKSLWEIYTDEQKQEMEETILGMLGIL